LAGKAAVLQIYIQDSPNLASRFGIHGIPATVLMKQGRVIDLLPGAQSLDAVLAWFHRKSQ
jgi:thioredoxin-like negative regulator of GroEL